MVDQINLPDKIVTRLMREVLPEDVQVSKDAKNAICKSASIFVLQLTIAAAERAQANKRRTLQDKDIIGASSTLSLEGYNPQLVRFSAQRKRDAKRKETKIAMAKSQKKASPIDAGLTNHFLSPSPQHEFAPSEIDQTGNFEHLSSSAMDTEDTPNE